MSYIKKGAEAIY